MCGFFLFNVRGSNCAFSDGTPMANHAVCVCQVFFVDDKTMPGWVVVLKVEARGKRINSTDKDHGLGMEASRDDLQVLTNMESESRGTGEGIGSNVALEQESNRRRRRTVDAL